MSKKTMTYEDLITLAKKYYNKGGDGVVECWDRTTFDIWVKEFGPMTKADAMRLIRS